MIAGEMFAAFSGELCKIAVTLGDLQERTSRVRGVVHNDELALQGGGALHIRSPQVAYAAVARHPNIGDHPPAAIRAYVKQELAPVAHLSNKIILPTESRGMAAWGSAPRAAEFRAVLTAHELYERRVKARDTFPTGYGVSTHAAPEVLLKEHNLFSKLEGPRGPGSAHATFQSLRRNTGESEAVRNLLTSAFGERATQFLNPSEKVPKAMIRHLRKKIRTNPALVTQAFGKIADDPKLRLLPRVRGLKMPRIATPRITHGTKGQVPINPFSGNWYRPAKKVASLPNPLHAALGITALAGAGSLAKKTVGAAKETIPPPWKPAPTV